MSISEADILRYHYSFPQPHATSSSSTAGPSSSGSTNRKCSNCAHPIDAPSAHSTSSFTGITPGTDLVPARNEISRENDNAVAGPSRPSAATQAEEELRRTAEELGRLAKEVVGVHDQSGAGQREDVESKSKKRKKKADNMAAKDTVGLVNQAGTKMSSKSGADELKKSKKKSRRMEKPDDMVTGDAFGLIDQAGNNRLSKSRVESTKKSKKKRDGAKGSRRKTDLFDDMNGQDPLLEDTGLDLTALAQRVLSDGNAMQGIRNTIDSPDQAFNIPAIASSYPSHPSYELSTPQHISHNRPHTHMLDPDLMLDPQLEMDELSTPSQPMLARQIPRGNAPVYSQGARKGGEAARTRLDVLAGRGKKSGKTGWAVGTPGGYA